MEVANNYTSQRKVENGGTLDAKLLEGSYNTFMRFMNNLDDSINNSLNVLFGVKPLSYIDKTPTQKGRINQDPHLIQKSRITVLHAVGLFALEEALPSKQHCPNFPVVTLLLKVLNVPSDEAASTITRHIPEDTTVQIKR